MSLLNCKKVNYMYKVADNAWNAWNVNVSIEEVPGCLVHCEPREDKRGERQVRVK